MQDIRKKHSNLKSNFPVSRNLENRGDTSISHIGLSGEESRRPRFVRSDDISMHRHERDDESGDTSEIRHVRNNTSHKGRTWRKVKSILSFTFFVVIFFGIYYTLTYVFDRATVTVIPNYRDVTLSATPIKIGTQGTIPFEVITTEAIKTKSLPKTTTTTVDKKASGEITIYNNFSATPQRLVKFTRFEASNKKIYKIPDSIVVPGKVGDKPGELTVKVNAESDGPSYNIEADSFTIPGFKGKDQYTKIYAKSLAPIAGGSSGSKAIVALTDLNAAKDELALNLRENIKKDFTAKAYDKKIPILDSVTLSIVDNSAEVLRGDTDIYSAKAVGSIAVVEMSALGKIALGGDVNKTLSYTFIASKDLAFSVDDNTPLLASTTLSMVATGGARVIWVTDYIGLRDKLISKSKKEFTTIISNDKTVSSATLSIFPPWKTDFPTHKDSIMVKEKLPEYKL